MSSLQIVGTLKECINIIDSLQENDITFTSAVLKCVTFYMQQSEESKDVISHINTQLSKPTGKEKALKVLDHVLPHCSQKILQNNCLSWMYHCLRTDNKKSVFNVQFTIMGKLITLCNHFPDFHKVVINDHLLKSVVEQCLSVHPKSRVAIDSLRCLIICLKTYMSTCISFKTKIENYIFKNVDSTLSTDIMESMATCFLLTSQIGSAGNGEINYIDNYSSNLVMLYNSLYNLYDELYRNIDEFELEFTKSDKILQFTKDNDKLTNEEVLRYLAQRLRCISHLLLRFLNGGYYSKKSFQPEQLLTVVRRGISVHVHANSNDLQKSLHSFIIQEHQIDLLSILKALIGCLKHTFLRFTVSQIILDCLTRTTVCECFKNNSEYKTVVYDVLNFFVVHTGKQLNDKFYEKCISHIINDMKEQELETNLIIKKGTDKEKKQKLDNLNLLSSNKIPLGNEQHAEELCVAALSTLEVLLKTVVLKPDLLLYRHLFGAFLKPLLNISAKMYRVPYKSNKSRVALYKGLSSLFYQDVMFYDIALSINLLHLGLKDPDIEIMNICWNSLIQLERVCQPLHTSLYMNYDQNLLDIRRLEKASNVQENGSNNIAMECTNNEISEPILTVSNKDFKKPTSIKRSAINLSEAIENMKEASEEISKKRRLLEEKSSSKVENSNVIEEESKSDSDDEGIVSKADESYISLADTTINCSQLDASDLADSFVDSVIEDS